jgi:hypothetical protein
MPIFYLKYGFMGVVTKPYNNYYNNNNNQNDDLYECKIIPPIGHKSLKFITSSDSNKDFEKENLPFKINNASNGQISWFDNNNYLANLNIMVEYLCII